MDSFLAEVAPVVNLKPGIFQSLADSVPNYARLYDDGLYRAIDVFLKVCSESLPEYPEINIC